MLKNIWKFYRRLIAIWEHVTNSTLYKLYANDSPESALSYHGKGIAVLILRIEILNFEKIDFWLKIYENSVEDVHHTSYMQLIDQRLFFPTVAVG